MFVLFSPFLFPSFRIIFPHTYSPRFPPLLSFCFALLVVYKFTLFFISSLQVYIILMKHYPDFNSHDPDFNPHYPVFNPH